MKKLSRTELIERFWIRVEKSYGCWNWRGTINPKGYGELYVGNNRSVRAHRFAYELLKGPIPPGLTIDHLCRTRACVNPDHLEVVTATENVMRGRGFAPINKAKTHCIHGHAFDAANTYVTNLRRKCIACQRRRSAAHEITRARIN